jgi:hypothetical protein
MEHDHTDLVPSEGSRHHDYCKRIVSSYVVGLLWVLLSPSIDRAHNRAEEDDKARQRHCCRCVKLEESHVHGFVDTSTTNASHLAKPHQDHEHKRTKVLPEIKAGLEHSFVDTAGPINAFVALVYVIWDFADVILVDALVGGGAGTTDLDLRLIAL